MRRVHAADAGVGRSPPRLHKPSRVAVSTYAATCCGEETSSGSVLQACERAPGAGTTLDRVTPPDFSQLKGAPLLVAAGLFDREVYEVQVGHTFADEVTAAWDYLRGGQAGVLLPHPLLDPLLLPADVRRALAAGRVRILVDHIQEVGLPADPDARARLLALLREPVEPVAEPVVDWPSLRAGLAERVADRVSVVIPTWNDVVMTERAVARVLANSSGLDVEVVVVDNGSRRDLGARLRTAYAGEPWVRVERMPRNLNFALGSNVGFARSSGATIVFLNNDTEVHEGWLPPLLSHLEDLSVQGVQPLLLYPDDTIQAAGTVFPLDDSLPCHFLVGEPPEAAAGLAAQRFHVVTAAALAMRAADVARLKGFDTRYVNGMEDVDLCLRAADEPAFVVEPASVVTHHESKTPGRGAHIPANRAAFMERWRGRLPAGEPERWTALGLRIAEIELGKAEIPSPRLTVVPYPPGLQTRLLLHVGMSKTGSSALQVEFVRARQVLAEHGWSYPVDESDDLAVVGGVTSGNGLPLARLLVPGLAPPGADPARVQERALTALRRHAGENVLLSSEFLWQLDGEALERFVRQANAQGFRVEAVGYVRDIAGHALSEYSQRVKRHLLTASFGEFIGGDTEQYDAGMRAWVTRLRSVLGAAAVRVHHYDSHRVALPAHFFGEILGIGSAPDNGSTVVNRSLTVAEIEIMREVNARVGSRRAARFASDELLAGPPLGELAVGVSEAELSVLEDRFGDEVAWLNGQALEEPVLSVRGEVAVRPSSEVAGAELVAAAVALAARAEARAQA
jgi:GT2 family glycosyltransferase